MDWDFETAVKKKKRASSEANLMAMTKIDREKRCRLGKKLKLASIAAVIFILGEWV